VPSGSRHRNGAHHSPDAGRSLPKLGLPTDLTAMLALTLGAGTVAILTIQPQPMVDPS
jgi:hypothetical protein